VETRLENHQQTETPDQTYYDVRDESPLPANLVQAARNRAAEAVKGCVERWKKGKASKPHFTSRFASYDARTGTVNDDHATLATIDGRVTADFILLMNGVTPHSAYLFNDDYDVNGATLHYDEVEDCFYLHVRTKPAVENDEAEQGDAKHVSVLGVDLGITNIATTSTGRFWVAANSTTGIESTRSAGATSTNRDSMGTRECSAGRSQTNWALRAVSSHDLERTCEGSS